MKLEWISVTRGANGARAAAARARICQHTTCYCVGTISASVIGAALLHDRRRGRAIFVTHTATCSSLSNPMTRRPGCRVNSAVVWPPQPTVQSTISGVGSASTRGTSSALTTCTFPRHTATHDTQYTSRRGVMFVAEHAVVCSGRSTVCLELIAKWSGDTPPPPTAVPISRLLFLAHHLTMNASRYQRMDLSSMS